MLSFLKKLFGGSSEPVQSNSTAVEAVTTVVENKVEEAPAPAKKVTRAKKPAAPKVEKPKAAPKAKKPKAPKAPKA